jgi:hypothetical protein
VRQAVRYIAPAAPLAGCDFGRPVSQFGPPIFQQAQPDEGRMVVNIIRTRRGEAPDTADRIIINRNGDRFGWTGTVQVGGSAVFGRGPSEWRTVHEAETDALAWAMSHGATQVMIEPPQG